VAVPGTVLTLDPADLTVRTRMDLAGMELVNDLWVTETDVWLSANVTDAALGLDGGSILRLDPATGLVTAVYRLGPESSGVVVGGDVLWAVDQRDNRLVRFRAPMSRGWRIAVS
jgi:sugar lactone lactonase YvrE